MIDNSLRVHIDARNGRDVLFHETHELGGSGLTLVFRTGFYGTRVEGGLDFSVDADERPPATYYTTVPPCDLPIRDQEQYPPVGEEEEGRLLATRVTRSLNVVRVYVAADGGRSLLYHRRFHFTEDFHVEMDLRVRGIRLAGKLDFTKCYGFWPPKDGNNRIYGCPSSGTAAFGDYGDSLPDTIDSYRSYYAGAWNTE